MFASSSASSLIPAGPHGSALNAAALAHPLALPLMSSPPSAPVISSSSRVDMFSFLRLHREERRENCKARKALRLGNVQQARAHEHTAALLHQHKLQLWEGRKTSKPEETQQPVWQPRWPTDIAPGPIPTYSPAIAPPAPSAAPSRLAALNATAPQFLPTATLSSMPPGMTRAFTDSSAPGLSPSPSSSSSSPLDNDSPNLSSAHSSAHGGATAASPEWRMDAADFDFDDSDSEDEEDDRHGRRPQGHYSHHNNSHNNSHSHAHYDEHANARGQQNGRNYFDSRNQQGNHRKHNKGHHQQHNAPAGPVATRINSQPTHTANGFAPPFPSAFISYPPSDYRLFPSVST